MLRVNSAIFGFTSRAFAFKYVMSNRTVYLKHFYLKQS